MSIDGGKALRLATLGIAIACACVGIWHVKAVAERKQKLAGLQVQLEDVRDAAAAVGSAELEIESMKEVLHRFVRQVPKETELGSLLESLNPSDGLQTGMSASLVGDREIATRPSISGYHLTRTPILLRFRGSFGDMFDVVERIEQSRQLVRVDRILVERPGSDPARPLQIEMEFSAFARNSQELESWAQIE